MSLHTYRQAFLLALSLLTAAALVATPLAAYAKRKPDKGNSHHAHKQVKKLHKELYGGGGPPPWAPAHGYRRKHGGATVYVPPFGIDVGICNRQLIGAAMGGAAGGLLASELADRSDKAVAVAGGVILGAMLGGSIGRSMDQLDQRCVGQILEHAPSQRTVAWENPDKESRYAVTPDRTYQHEDGRYCREYTSTATIAGESQETTGTACRQPDGSWQIVN